MTRKQLQATVLRWFDAPCAEPGCGRAALCLPATKLDALGRARRTRYRPYRQWPGLWIYVGHYKAYLPGHMGLAAALRRYGRMRQAEWQPVCIRCLGQSYVRRGNPGPHGRRRLQGTWFGRQLTGKLRELRKSRNQAAALDRLTPALEEVITDSLVWQNTPARQRRGYLITES